MSNISMDNLERTEVHLPPPICFIKISPKSHWPSQSYFVQYNVALKKIRQHKDASIQPAISLKHVDINVSCSSLVNQICLCEIP